jgi:thiamine biosynthesis lipoprotein
MLHEHHFRAMNTDVGVWLYSSTALEADAAARALRWTEDFFSRVEREVSRFRPASGLSQLNTAGEGPQAVSPLLWRLLVAAVAAAEESGGIFDPTLLRTLECLGYDRSFEAIERIGSGDALGRRPHLGSWRRLRLDPIGHAVCRPADLGVDLGGIGKGWTVDQVVSTLAAVGPVLVDAGGDLRVAGAIDGEPWPIGFQDPFAPERDRGVVALTEGALATSSVGGRCWQRGGRQRHHVIDPRTGMPAESDLHTVTVRAPDATTADVAAKVVLVLGSASGPLYLRARGLSGLLTRTDGSEVFVDDPRRPWFSLEVSAVAPSGCPDVDTRPVRRGETQ